MKQHLVWRRRDWLYGMEIFYNIMAASYYKGIRSTNSIEWAIAEYGGSFYIAFRYLR
jgi:hypothetical protein